MGLFDLGERLAIWQKARMIPGREHECNEWRLDDFNNVICYSQYGDRSAPHGERSREYFAEALNKIADPDARRDAEDALRRFHECRGRRHRAIHDAVDVGLDVADNGRANAIGLRTRYLPNGTREVVPFTPDEVAGLAYEFYDIAKDFESIEYRIMRVPDPPGSGTTK